jgi:formamidopyrimidine-DNA glycosylase
MPEMPEVEVTRRGIAPALAGARVQAVRLGKPLRWPLGVAPEQLQGACVGDVQRRGKYLWLPLRSPVEHAPASAPAALRTAPTPIDDGPGLLLHLGMSGSLAVLAAPPPPGVHDHFDLVTDRGTLRLHDPRRFGAVVWSPGLRADPAAMLLARLGAEPFDPTLSAAVLHAALHRHRAAIKTVLLGGRVIVGAGNIYACEALFHAGIHPAARSDRISRPRAERLLAALRRTLQQALELGGTTLRDFSDAHGMDGAYQHQAAVYGREGLPCPRCSAPVKRRVQAQRSTYFCAGCQKR